MEQNLNRYREVTTGNKGNLAKRGETGGKTGNQPFKKDERRIKMKNLVRLMAIVAALGMVFITGPVMAGTQGDTGGSIPVIVTIDSISVNGEMTGSFFSGLTTADYDTGFKESSTAGTTVTITANTAWEVTVAAGLTGDYFTTSPLGLGLSPRTANQKPLTDLFIKVSNIDKGSDSNSSIPTIDGAWASYTNMTFDAKDLVTNASGNDTATWDIQFKMMLDTSKDRDGAYSVNVTYTIQEINDA